MSWLTLAQQERDAPKDALECDIRSRIDHFASSHGKFYLGSIYYSVPNPDAGGKWQAYRCETDTNEVIDRSPLYATKNRAVKWIANNAPRHFYAPDADPNLVEQFDRSYHVTVNGRDFAPVNRSDIGLFAVSTYPSTAEAMDPHRTTNRHPGMSTTVHAADASLLRRYVFSRYSDLISFLTSSSFPQIVASISEQDILHDWSGTREMFVPSIVGIVRELADRFKLPAGIVFTGRTIDRNQQVANASGRTEFDVAPYADLVPGTEQDDVFLSFRNGLIPEPSAFAGFRQALDVIVRRHFSDRRVDIIEDESGPMIAVRRSASESQRWIVNRFLDAEPLDPPDVPKAKVEPKYDQEYFDQDAGVAFDVMLSQDDGEFAINIVGLKKQAQSPVDTLAYVRALLAGSTDAVFCIEKNRYGIHQNADGKWIAYTSDEGLGREQITSGAGTEVEAIGKAAKAAHDYAEFRAYHMNPANTSTGALLDEIERYGGLRTNGYLVFASGPVAVGGSVPAYVVERTPRPRDVLRHSLMEVSPGDADVLRNYRFTRKQDAEIYIASGFDWNEWEGERPPVNTREDLETRNCAIRLREIGMPPGTRFVSRSGWEAMSAAVRMGFCGGDSQKYALLDNLRNSGVNIVALLFGNVSLLHLPGGIEHVATQIRNDLGYAVQTITDFADPILLVDSTLGSFGHPVSQPNGRQDSLPKQPVPEPVLKQNKQTPYYVNDQEMFKDIQLPEEDEAFGIVFSSARTASRKPIVVSFDYDGTTVFPIDLGHGLDYDEENEPVSELNPDAAELMRLHASRGDTVVIVTCRYPYGLKSVWKMIHDNGLPVSEVYATSHTSKAPTLRSIGASIHYEDSPFRSDEIKNALGSDIKVYPPEAMLTNARLWRHKSNRSLR